MDTPGLPARSSSGAISPINIENFLAQPRNSYPNSQIRRAEVLAFCNAIRAKNGWCTKVLDETRDLPMKWATEAQLLSSLDPEEAEQASLRVAQAINDLKAEARRIIDLDLKITLKSRSLPSQNVDFTSIDTDVDNAVKYARNAKFAISQPSLREQVGVYVSDGLVPKSLHQELLSQLDQLADLEPKDFHPGSDGKVLDLIHPSLYPYIAGSSPVTDESLRPHHPDNLFKSQIKNYSTYEFQSRYAWVPSKFQVSGDGLDVRIDSNINGLGPRARFPDLYRVIEKIFLLALPHFERTVAFDYKYEYTSAQKRWIERDKLRRAAEIDGRTYFEEAEWTKILVKQEKTKTKEAAKAKKARTQELKSKAEEILKTSKFYAGERTPSAWKGRELKVIVKAANYVLKAGQSYEGSWHMEGMPHERIVASVIYYYDTDPEIQDGGLGLRRLRESDIDFPDIERYRHENFKLRIKYEDSHEGNKNDASEDDDEEEERDGAESEDDYPSDWEQEEYKTGIMPMSTSSLNPFIDLGTIPTTNFKHDRVNFAGHKTGRMVSFPNWIQHKVLTVSNGAATDESAKPAYRKILCFFLVDDGDLTDFGTDFHGFIYTGIERATVLTTAEIPLQERCCNAATLHFLLPVIVLRLVRKRLPPELVDVIIAYAHAGTITRGEAEKHRLELMEDRRLRLGAYPASVWDRSFTLCEH